REGDTKSKQVDDVVKLATRMDEEATKLGVVKIKLRDFLTMTGYRVPRQKQDDLSKFLKPLSAPASPIDKTFAKPKGEGESKGQEKSTAVALIKPEQAFVSSSKPGHERLFLFPVPVPPPLPVFDRRMAKKAEARARD